MKNVHIQYHHHREFFWTGVALSVPFLFSPSGWVRVNPPWKVLQVKTSWERPSSKVVRTSLIILHRFLILQCLWAVFVWDLGCCSCRVRVCRCRGCCSLPVCVWVTCWSFLQGGRGARPRGAGSRHAARVVQPLPDHHHASGRIPGDRCRPVLYIYTLI